MKDLGDRFGQGESAPRIEARADPLARLHAHETSEALKPPATSRLQALMGRSDILALASAVLAGGLVLWPVFQPKAVTLPSIVQTGEDVATLTVKPLANSGVPDWYGLFNAYQLETALRDISIRCAYDLPVDARVDRYLHARLVAGSQVRIFLADPGTCPRT
jgi:hypothetical protein